MQNTKSLIIGLCAVAAATVIGVSTVMAVEMASGRLYETVGSAVNGLVKYKQSGEGGITATGSATVDFKSDQATWGGSFSAVGETAQDAYAQIKHDGEIIKKYLLDNGVDDDQLTFQAVDIRQQFRSLYSAEGNYMGEEPDGYRLTQRIFVSSPDVDKIEEISRDITRLIESGVEFYSDAPEYTYTRLDELKLTLIEEATQNAKQRIDLIAENADSRVGRLINANLGVFQITAWNSASEEYSASGTFNTRSIWKTASITVRLYYAVD